jgi:tetratricopeptide (TPR) repeat protein
VNSQLRQKSSPASTSLRRSGALAALAIVGSLFVSIESFGGDEHSWAGERIVTKREGLRIGHTDAAGWQVYVAELTDMVYTVTDEKDGWLLVRHGGAEGWLDKQQALLLDDAASFFAERIRLDMRDALAFAHRGRARQENGELERALGDLNEAIRLDPNNPAWLRARGLVYDELKDHDRAIRDYTEAIRFAPRDALTYNRRGMARKAKKEYEQAVRDYSDAIRFDPRWSDAFFNRGNSHKALKDFDRAINDFSEAIRLDPNWTDAYFNRANARRAKKEYARAVDDYRQAIRLDPKDADACGGLAWLLATCPEANVRDGKRAVEQATRACELTSWEAPYFLAVLAAAWAEFGDFEEALKWQQRALESPGYDREEGDKARQRVKLFSERRPYREE